tara:strand:- start:3762 stop:4892 length:1131 start_codon:yes stop_codon:yes gene_type:complete
MAKGKAPASRSLNYSLGGDILNRVKGSLDTGTTIKTIDEAATGVTDEITETAGKITNTLLGFEEQKAKEAAEEKRKEEEANAAYDEGMEAFGARSSWATGDTYDKFMQIEEEERKAFLDASMDPRLQQKILREQKERATQQQNWKGVFDGLKELKLLDNMDADSKKIIAAMTKQGKNFIGPVYDKKNKSLNMKILLNGEEKTITASEWDKIVTRNRRPTEEIKTLLEGVERVRADKSKNIPFNFNSEIRRNKDLITKDNINSLMKGDLGFGPNFLLSVQDHPDFSNVRAKGLGLKIPKGSTFTADVNKDGEIYGEEFLKLSQTDKVAVSRMMELPENFEIAKEYLAEFMTMNQQIEYNNYDAPLGYGKSTGKGSLN